jgi:hypothetical protein
MWPFSTRGARAATKVPERRAIALNFADFARNDSYFKLWLPEKVTQELDRLSIEHGTSRPDVLRALLFEHVYGRPAFDELVAWREKQTEQLASQRNSEVQFSRERSTHIEMFGKATDNIKFQLPARLKTDLAQLAATHQLGLSDYARKALICIFLGEITYNLYMRTAGILPPNLRELEAE